MNNVESKRKELFLSCSEMDVVYSIFLEVFSGIRLYENEVKIISNMPLGKEVKERVFQLYKEKQSVYIVDFTFDELVIIRNSLIVVFIEFNKYDIYHTRMGCSIDECILLLKRIDLEMLNWNRVESTLV